MKYIITASSISYYKLEVEADSSDEAWQIGKDADGSDFSRDGDGDWEVVDVQSMWSTTVRRRNDTNKNKKKDQKAAYRP